MVFYEGLGLHWFQDTENQNSTHQDTLWLYERAETSFKSNQLSLRCVGKKWQEQRPDIAKYRKGAAWIRRGLDFWKALLSVALISIVEVAKLHCIVRRGAPSISVRSQAHCQSCKPNVKIPIARRLKFCMKKCHRCIKTNMASAQLSVFEIFERRLGFHETTGAMMQQASHFFNLFHTYVIWVD